MSTILSYDPTELKQALITYLQSKPAFADFNYEGSAILTTIDFLTRNTNYIAYMANMVGTESFLDSAQLRANVVSHAQKLTYIPKSRTATTVNVDIEVIPTTTPDVNTFSITCNKGSTFLNTIDNVNYQFTNTDDLILFKTVDNTFKATDVNLKQGQIVSEDFLYTSGSKIEISNVDVDTSTLRVYVKESSSSTTQTEYTKVSDITEVAADGYFYYLYENTKGLFEIEFGKNVLGYDPLDNSVVTIEYVICESDHANGISTLIAATPIENYSNITITVNTNGYGGSEKNDIDFIKFIAPKVYETQNRAVRIQDYETLMLRDFGFIRSAKAWGGEDNVPPYYGKVFLCAIPQSGFIIADSVKTIIENQMKSYSMMGPIVVDAQYIGINLYISILFDANSTTDTYTQTVAKVQTVINDYNATLKTFDFWYNNSKLSKNIRDISSITSIEINKEIFFDLTVSQNKTEKYIVEFLNKIEPSSLMITDIVLDATATNQYITDDGNGNVIKNVTISGVETTEIIGSIDYDTGYTEFTSFIISPDTIRVVAIPTTDNVYTERMFAVYINSSQIDRISR
jgi:hypothetical protein